MYLHKNGIIHRDLKPNNILVDCQTDKPVLKIADFNVAKFIDKFETTDIFNQNAFEMNTHTGTLAFRAPEIFTMSKYTFID